MRKSTMHVLLTASILIFSSLAGCLGTVDEEDGSKGTVLVSTYHVEQIVSAIAGDTLNVETLSPSNVPVHDYEPSAADLVRLQGADLFFYHGLGLETWVDATMDSLGDDAPPSFSTHAMPTGQAALDYEGLLVDQLCKSLSAPGTTDVHILAESMYFADEIHSDDAAHNLAMPEDEHHDDHDGHDDHDDRDDHDDHEDHDDHSDHDEHDHDGHGLVRAEETLTASSDCPTETTITVYGLEAGEYMLEFEAKDIEAFTIAIAAMGGAHHPHHDHDGEHADEHSDEGDDDHEDEHDGHDDHWDAETCHDEDTHETHEEYTTEEDCEAAGHMWMDEGHDMDADEMIEMFDTDSDGLLSMSEFLTMAEEMEDDDHDHDDDSGDDSGDGHDDHDEHDPVHEIEMAMFEMMFHMADMNEDEHLDGDELNRLIAAMEGDLPIDGEEMAEIYFGVFDEDEDDNLSLDEFSEMMEMMMAEEEGIDDHDHGENETHDEDHDDNMTEMMFTMYDADEDGNISMEEFSEVMEMMGEDHEEGLAYIGLHVEEEGDYGFALPAGVELHILSMGGHEGHDHGSHGEGEMVCYDMSTHTVDTTHTTEEACEGAGLMWTENQRPDDHDDDETHDDDDHRDEEGHDDHGDEKALAYDPHSWLDPLAYKAQVALVLGEMKTAFPNLADTFQTNADAFMASLDEVDADYNAAFGPNGTCTNNTVAANHNAYSYIAYRYNLEFVTVHGIDPEGEPSAADIAEVVEKIEEDAITVLFVEEYTDETAVNSIADQTNGAVTVQTLYTMELPPKDSNNNYLSLMEKNLNSLKAGLDC